MDAPCQEIHRTATRHPRTPLEHALAAHGASDEDRPVRDDESKGRIMVTLNPYLNFRDDAKEAMEFYQSVFGGELTSSTFAEFGAADDPVDADKIMHSQLESGGITLMGADTPSHNEYSATGNVSVSLSGTADEDATLRGYWEKLSGSGS